jgi:hypothetical protein
LIGQGTADDLASSEALPVPWRDAPVTTVSSRDEVSVMHSLAPAFALASLLTRPEKRVLLRGVVPLRGCCILGFETSEA